MRKVKKNIMIIGIIILLILLSWIIVTKKNLIEKKEVKNEIEEMKTEEQPKEENTIETVYVDIKGAVIHPGVYEIDENKKVIDIVNLAGGFTENADTSMINLAKKVKNEMVVIIYTKEEVKKWTEPNQIIKYIDKECICPNIKNDGCLKNETETKAEKDKTTSSTNEVININSASLEELQKISGVGESKAKAIIEYREKNEGFKTKEEIKEVPGIGESLYEKIKDSITI